MAYSRWSSACTRWRRSTWSTRSSSTPDGPAAVRIAHELGLPLSIKARGADISFWGGKAYALRKMLHAGRQAAGLLAVSAELAGRMAALGFARDKITVHYTGLDHSRFRPLGRGAAARGWPRNSASCCPTARRCSRRSAR